MRFYRVITLTDGGQVILRSLEKKDAGAAVFCLRNVSGETAFLMREVSECGMTIAQEEEIIARKMDNPREMLLGVFIGDELVGMAGLNGCGPFARVRHRASIGVSLLRAYWGRGIGTAMMHALIEAAKTTALEQLELNVVSTNEAAQRLYERCGFKEYGRHPRMMKYRDGTYADAVLMMLDLRAGQ